MSKFRQNTSTTTLLLCILAELLFSSIARSESISFQPIHVSIPKNSHLATRNESNPQPLDGGCYYDGTQPYGCIGLTTQLCDQQWVYQLVSELPNKNGFFVQQDIFVTGDPLIQCHYTSSGTCTFCTIFNNTRVIDNKLIFSVSTSFCTSDLQPIGDFYALGIKCGTKGYFYFPCEYMGLPSTHFPLNTLDRLLSSLNDYVTAGRIPDSDWTFASGCVFLPNRVYNVSQDHPELLIPVFCPLPTLDPCTPNAFLQSRGGIFTKLFLNMEYRSTCFAIGTATVCIQARNVSIYHVTVSFSLDIFVYNHKKDDPIGIFSQENLTYTFPKCGDSLKVGCSANYTFPDESTESSEESDSGVIVIPVSSDGLNTYRGWFLVFLLLVVIFVLMFLITLLAYRAHTLYHAFKNNTEDDLVSLIEDDVEEDNPEEENSHSPSDLD